MDSKADSLQVYVHELRMTIKNIWLKKQFFREECVDKSSESPSPFFNIK